MFQQYEFTDDSAICNETGSAVPEVLVQVQSLTDVIEKGMNGNLSYTCDREQGMKLVIRP